MSCKVEYLKLDFSPPKSVDWMETHQQSRRMAMEVKMRRRRGRVGGSNVKWNFTAQVSRPQRFTKQVLLVKGVMIQIWGPRGHTLEIEKVSFRFSAKSHHQGKGYSMSMISPFSCCSSRCGVPARAGEILGGWWHGRKWRRRNWRGARIHFFWCTDSHRIHECIHTPNKMA